MPLTKAKDIRNYSAEELTEKIRSLKTEIFTLNQKKHIGQLDRPHRIKQVRREIAQINTIISERERHAKN